MLHLIGLVVVKFAAVNPIIVDVVEEGQVYTETSLVPIAAAPLFLNVFAILLS